MKRYAKNNLFSTKKLVFKTGVQQLAIVYRSLIFLTYNDQGTQILELSWSEKRIIKDKTKYALPYLLLLCAAVQRFLYDLKKLFFWVFGICFIRQ